MGALGTVSIAILLGSQCVADSSVISSSTGRMR